jgi:glycerol kinase
MARYVGAVDQGTTSTRFMVFDKGGNEISRHQLEHQQILPQPGWVEHDPLEITARTDEVIARAMRNANITAADLAAIGVTNQRETTIVWNPKTGRPWYNAIVWQGHAHRSHHQRARRRTGGLDPLAHRPAAGDLLLGREDPVDPRQRPRRPRRGGARRKPCSAIPTPGSSGI